METPAAATHDQRSTSTSPWPTHKIKTERKRQFVQQDFSRVDRHGKNSHGYTKARILQLY
jgi:hypothetical protein